MSIAVRTDYRGRGREIVVVERLSWVWALLQNLASGVMASPYSFQANFFGPHIDFTLYQCFRTLALVCMP